MSLAAALFSVSPAEAQRLAVRQYTVADGLAQDTVGDIFQDSRGYLWFSTAEGVSRFDGYTFQTYDTADGLPHSVINYVREDPRGRVWVAAMAGGLSRFVDGPTTPAARRDNMAMRFVTHALSQAGMSDSIGSLTFGHDSSLWCVTRDGIYRARDEGDGTALRFTNVLSHPPPTTRDVAFTDRGGRLWFGIDRNVVAFVQDRAITYAPDTEGAGYVTGFAESADGTIVLARTRSVSVFVPGREIGARGAWRDWGLDLPGDLEITAIALDAGGRLWIGTTRGVLRADPASRVPVRVRGPDGRISKILQDRERNLWISTFGAGVYKVPSQLIVSWTGADGLLDPSVVTIVEGLDGRIYASNRRGIVEITQTGAVEVPGSTRFPFTTIERRLIRGRSDDWWALTDAGLFHVRGVRLQFVTAERVVAAGLASGPFGPALYEDEEGIVWMGQREDRLLGFDPTRSGPSAWRTVALPRVGTVSRFASDRTGAMWLGTYNHLVRMAHGRALDIDVRPGLPQTFVRALFADSRGWLWVGTRYNGVSVTRNPDAADLRFTQYSKGQGISSEMVGAIAEDAFGRIYLGTGKGLDRWDPATGRFSHLTTDDGLAGAAVNHCFRDHAGNIWLATQTGVSMLPVERAPMTDPAPPIYITRAITGEGDASVLASAGTPSRAEVSPSRSSLRVEYVAISFRGIQTLRYQYKLDGIDREWSAPTEERAVTYARLAPGDYRFRVRVIDAEGSIGSEAETSPFRVLRPLWQRWWFLTAASLTLLLAGISLHRFRLRQLLAVERVRRQVSLDLHDDVGSGLVQIAVMSELANADGATGPRMWPEVAALSRSLRDSMSDIVWAVDPHKDRLRDLIERMKDVAFNMLEADGTRVEFRAPAAVAVEKMSMPTDRRRHVLLVFKEAITNVARHARASRVEIDVAVTANELRLVVQDDGCGFDVEAAHAGHGLISLRRRAEELGGTLLIRSEPRPALRGVEGSGTTVVLTAPVR